jgi:hypothetical protein
MVQWRARASCEYCHLPADASPLPRRPTTAQALAESQRLRERIIAAGAV